MEQDPKHVQDKLIEAIKSLREAIDMSVQIKAQGGEADKQICRLWENFLGDFFSYIRQKSKEAKQNLLAGISFPRF